MAKKRTYADEAKTIMSKYKTRLGEKFDKGDVLALEAMNQELQGLQRKQEKERIQKLIEGANDEQISQLSQALQGGGQGQPQQQFQPQNFQGPQQPGIPQGGPSGLATGQAPQATGQAQFAGGGKLPKYQGEGINPNFLNAQNYGNQQQLTAPINYLNPQTGAFSNIPGAQQQAGGGVSFGNRSQLAQNQDFNALQAANQSPSNLGYDPITSLGQYQDQASFGAYDDPSEFLASQGGTGLNALNAPTNTVTNQTGGDDFTPFKSRVPYFGAIAQGIGAIAGNRNIDFDPYAVEDVQAERITPRTVDFSRGREQIQRERDLSQAQIRTAAKGRGTQQGLTQATIAGATEAQRIAGTGIEASVESQGNINAKIRNETAARNQQSQLQAAITNQRNQQFGAQVGRENQLINEQRRGQRIGGVTSAIAGYGKDRLQADQYDQMLQIMAPDNYRFGQGQDSKFRRALQISPTMQRSFSDLGQRLFNKQG